MPKISLNERRPMILAAAAAASALVLVACGTAEAASSPAAEPAPTAASTLKLARTLRGAGDLDAAIGAYRTVMASKPLDPAVQVEFGDALLEAGLIDQAMGVYGQIDPKSKGGVDALMGLAQARLKLGSPDRALAYADRAVAIAPTEPRAQVLRGVILDGAGRHAEAQACYRAALQQLPRSVAARNNLALSLAIVGHYAEALDLLEPIARSSDASPGLRQNLALIYGLKGDREKALALGRADLGPAVAEANQRFADMVREASSKR